MIKLFTLLCCILFLIACGQNKSEYDQYYGKEKQTEESVAATAEEATEEIPQGNDTTVAANAALLEQGAKLISLSDCLACHTEDKKLVGPAYQEVANKYELNEKNVNYLAGKIINGGSGVWGQVPMTPHPDISKEDARAMAHYILSLRK